MMEAVIAAVAFAASMLTFYSGFGLGTLLTPVFAIFFPVESAIALTGIVHLLNNLFKIGLTWKNIRINTALSFGIASIAGAFAGASLLSMLAHDEAVYQYILSGRIFYVTPLKLIVASLMIIFTLLELLTREKKIQMAEKYIYAGGVISGFFGGLSGHQGALRSLFLMRTGMTKENFIATGILIACMVDITRLAVYADRLQLTDVSANINVLMTAVAAAFAGAYTGNRFLKKVTLESVQWIVTIFIVLLSVALAAGLV
jgi:uncharacterized protein